MLNLSSLPFPSVLSHPTYPTHPISLYPCHSSLPILAHCIHYIPSIPSCLILSHLILSHPSHISHPIHPILSHQIHSIQFTHLIPSHPFPSIPSPSHSIAITPVLTWYQMLCLD